MASENDTVAEIGKKVRSGDYGCAKCGDLCDCPNTDKIIASIAARIEVAHNRELATKDDERLTIVANYENVIAAKDREIAELRECLKEAVDYNCSLCKCKGKACEFDGFCAEQKWRKALKGGHDGK